MTVEQLISKLQQYPQDAEVIQRDVYFGYFEAKPVYDSHKKIVLF